MGQAERLNAARLASKLRNAEAMNGHYLRAVAALLIQKDGEIRIPASTFALIDPEMVIRQSLDEETKEVVLSLVATTAQEPVN